MPPEQPIEEPDEIMLIEIGTTDTGTERTVWSSFDTVNLVIKTPL